MTYRFFVSQVQYRSVKTSLGAYGPPMAPTDPDGPRRTHYGPDGPRWPPTDPDGPTMDPMAPDGPRTDPDGPRTDPGRTPTDPGRTRADPDGPWWPFASKMKKIAIWFIFIYIFGKNYKKFKIFIKNLEFKRLL